MKPIAFIAFLVGINSTPTIPPHAVAEQKTSVERTHPKPSKGECGAKRRGGWDFN